MCKICFKLAELMCEQLQLLQDVIRCYVSKAVHTFMRTLSVRPVCDYVPIKM